MSVSNSNTSSKCLICYSSFPNVLRQSSEQFSTVFDTLCGLLKIDLIKSMQWNFEEDNVPFCGFCVSAVEKLQGLYDQIESLQHQVTYLLNRIKDEIIQTSGNDTLRTNELTACDRVNYFRQLVVGGPFRHTDHPITSFNENPGIKVKTESDESEIEHSFLERIDEPCEHDDPADQSDPLLSVKSESYVSSDSIDVDAESFAEDNMVATNDSIFLDPSDPAFSVQESISCTTVTDPETNNKCKFCERTFKRKGLLELHLTEHLNQNKIHCEKCSGIFLTKDDLILHESQVHGTLPKKNSEVVSNKRKLNKNIIKSKKLPLDEKLGVVKQFKKEKTVCEVCEKDDASSEQFSSLHSLTCYKRCHSMVGLKYKCDFCGKMIHKPSALIKHRRIHTGEKPYKCEVCLKTFKQLCALRTHGIVHTGEKSYNCHICNKDFSYSCTLTKHLRRTHAYNRDRD